MNIGSFLGEMAKGASGYASRSREIENEKLMKMLGLLGEGDKFAGSGNIAAIKKLGLDEPTTQSLIKLAEQGIADRDVQRRGQVATTELAEKKAAAFGTEEQQDKQEQIDVSYKIFLDPNSSLFEFNHAYDKLIELGVPQRKIMGTYDKIFPMKQSQYLLGLEKSQGELEDYKGRETEKQRKEELTIKDRYWDSKNPFEEQSNYKDMESSGIDIDPSLREGFQKSLANKEYRKEIDGIIAQYTGPDNIEDIRKGEIETLASKLISNGIFGRMQLANYIDDYIAYKTESYMAGVSPEDIMDNFLYGRKIINK